MKNVPARSSAVTRLLDKHRGVKLNGVWYWAPEFADKRVRPRKLTVYPDLLNENLCHVEVEGKWVRCVPTTERRQQPRVFWN